MLVIGSPQFETQDDFGNGDGIAPIDQWQTAVPPSLQFSDSSSRSDLGIDPALGDIVARLRIILEPSGDTSDNPTSLSTSDLHDLTCFVLHRLLRPHTAHNDWSEALGLALSLYMFIMHGPTYYSHLGILYKLVHQLQHHIQALAIISCYDDLVLWCLTVGMLASMGTDNHTRWASQALGLSKTLGLCCWDDIERRLQIILPVDATSRSIFRTVWKPLIDPPMIHQESELPDGSTFALQNLLN